MTFLASVHICLCGPVLGVDVSSCSGESAKFGSASHSDNAHKSPSLVGASGCSRSPSVGLVWLESYDPVGHAICLSLVIRLCSRPLLLIAISGYRLLCLYPLPIFMFHRLIIHNDSLRVVLYPPSVSMPMEPKLFFSVGTCRTWCKMIVLLFGNWMGTLPIPTITHTCPLPNGTV